MPELTRVHSPYLGRSYYVATADLNDPRRVGLPIYSRTGVKWSDMPSRRGKANTLHRDNIGARPMTVAEAAAMLDAAIRDAA